eukprot:268844_1
MANQLSSFQTLIQSIETFINDIGTFINDSDSNEPMSRDKITDCLQQLQTKCVEIRQQYIPIDNLIYLSSQASSSSTKPSQAAQDKKRLTGKESNDECKDSNCNKTMLTRSQTDRTLTANVPNRTRHCRHDRNKKSFPTQSQRYTQQLNVSRSTLYAAIECIEINAIRSN